MMNTNILCKIKAHAKYIYRKVGKKKGEIKREAFKSLPKIMIEYPLL